MTTDRRRDGARGGRRRATVAAALVAVLVGGACAQEADGPDAAIGGDAGEFAASEQYLAGVAAATEGSSYRMSMDMTMVGEDAGGSFEVGGTFMTGEVDGDRTSTHNSGARGNGLEVPCRLMYWADAQTTSGARMPSSVSIAHSVIVVPSGRVSVAVVPLSKSLGPGACPLGSRANIGSRWRSLAARTPETAATSVARKAAGTISVGLAEPATAKIAIAVVGMI